MEDLYPSNRGCFFQATDRPPPSIRPGVALSRHHHSNGGLVLPLRSGHVFEASIDRCIKQFQETRLQQHHQRLTLRVAKPHVELQHLGALGGQHQAGVEQPLKRCLPPLHGVDRGDEDLFFDLREHRRINKRRGAVGAHAAGVGAHVTVVGGFVILQRRQRHNGAAIGDRHHAHLHAVEPLLDQDRLLVASEGLHRLQGLGFGGADKHSFASRQPVGLHHQRRLLPSFDVLASLGCPPELFVACRRHVTAVQHLFAEGFTALQASRVGGGAEDPQFLLLERIHDASHEGSLRPDHRQVDPLLNGGLRQPFDVVDGDR